MNCRDFINHLEDLLDDALSAERRRAMDRHCRDCAGCREMRRTFEAEVPEAEVDPPPNLLPGILAGTSGTACDRARELLCGRVDRSIETFDNELMRSHLDGCPDCACLERVLVAMREDLPALAEEQPDERFVDDVLARTLPRPSGLRRWVLELQASWRQLIRRPRIAWEGAYVGALVLTLMFGIPNSPLADVPVKALELARINPVRELEGPLGAAERQVAGGVEAAWRSSKAQLSSRWDRLYSDLSKRSTAAVEGIRTDLGTLLDRGASDPESDEQQPRPEATDRTQGETE